MNFTPTELRIEVSTLCNARCNFCPHDTSFSRNKTTMTTEKYKIYLDKVLTGYPSITDVVFSGFGEVFLDSEVFEKMEYVNSKGLNIHILSNGSLIEESTSNKLFQLDNLKSIRISIHTSEAEKYDKIMNYKSNISFDDVLLNIRHLLDHKDENVDIILTAVVEDSNTLNLNDMIDKYSKDCYLEVWKPHNWVYGENYRSGDSIKKTCGRPFSGPIEVLVNGDVIMCCFDYNSKMILGNLNESSILDIYSSEKYLEIVNHHSDGTCGSSNLECNGCDQLLDKSDVLIYSNRDSNDRKNSTSTTLNLLDK